MLSRQALFQPYDVYEKCRSILYHCIRKRRDSTGRNDRGKFPEEFQNHIHGPIRIFIVLPHISKGKQEKPSRSRHVARGIAVKIAR